MRLLSRGFPTATGLLLLASTARGQQMAGVEAMDFKIQLENYAPPFEAQPRTLLESAKVQPQQGGKILMTDAKLKTFSTNGTLELLAQSPQCIFDSNQRTASSPEPLQLETGDRRFFTEGQGFLWDQTNSTLLISNRVHTITWKDLLTSPPSTSSRRSNQAADAIEVFSDRFGYDRNSGLVSYHSHVRVTGTNLQLTANHLYLELPAPGASFKSIVAEGDVVIQRGDLHATGDRAAYSYSTSAMTITGHPAWSMGPREGRGDELVLDRTNNLFRATGHAYLKLPRDSTGPTLLLNPKPVSTASPEPEARFFEITSDSYELSTNLAVFRDHVHSSELADGVPQGKLNCGLMTLWFSGSNQVQRVVAFEDVVAEQNEERITANKAVFSATNPAVEFTGKPAWQSGRRQGSGDVLILDRLSHEMKVQGNARAKLPASQFQIVAMNRAAASTNTGPAVADLRFVEISSDDYDLREDLSVFHGNVRVKDPRGRLSCDLLNVTSSQTPGDESRNAVAERKQNRVEIVWVDAKGQTNFSWSDKAVYSYSIAGSVTNELVTFSGSPVITNPQGTHTGDPIIWDRIRNTVHATGGKSEIRENGTNAPASFQDPEAPKVNAPGATNGETAR